MATNVTGVVNLPIKLTRAVAGGSMSTPTDYGTFSFPNTSFASGTSAASLEEAAWSTLSVVGTNVSTVDLSDTTGAGLVMQGSAVAFTKIKTFWVYNRSTNAADIVTVTFNASNGWTSWVSGTMTLKPGMACGFVDAGTTGLTVTAGTLDLVKFVNAATNTVSLDLMIAGNKS